LAPSREPGVSRPPTSNVSRAMGAIVDVVAEHDGVAAIPYRT
jgi:hypothetical protein